MKRLVFFVAFMTLGTAALIQLLVTEPEQAGPQAPPPPEAANVLVMNGVDLRQLDGQRLRWELQAERAVYDDNTTGGRMAQVAFRIYEAPAPGAPPSVITGSAAVAEVNSKAGQLVLLGRVVLTRGSALEIRSERIEYDDRKLLITSPGPVHVRSPQGIQEGTSLVYSVGEEHLQLTNPVFYQ